jgi:hypothetical protein
MKFNSIIKILKIYLKLYLFFIAINLNNSKSNADSSLSNSFVNTKILTKANYLDNIVYVYEAISNEAENLNKPEKWIFYYFPLMIPIIKTDSDFDKDSWISIINNNSISINLIIGNDELEELIRKEVSKKYKLNISENAASWDIMPLMIDSLTAFITSDNNPVSGVSPYHIVNPNLLKISLKFKCSSNEIAQNVLENILNNNYNIEISFYFSGFQQIKSNIISVTSENLQNIISKTNSDGGSLNPNYIHKSQLGKFISTYTNNIIKMIYFKESNKDSSTISNELHDLFILLLEKCII